MKLPFQKTTEEEQENTESIKEELQKTYEELQLEKEKNDEYLRLIEQRTIDFPFAKKKKYLGIIKNRKIKTKKEDKDLKPIEPICMILRSDGLIEIKENVQPGRMRLSLGKGQGFGFIDLSQSDLRKIEWGNDFIWGFVVQDNHAKALPFDKTVDPIQTKQAYDTIVTNRANVAGKQIEAVGGLLVKIGLVLGGLVFLYFLMAMAGFDFLGILTKKPAEQAPEIAANTAKYILDKVSKVAL